MVESISCSCRGPDSVPSTHVGLTVVYNSSPRRSTLPLAIWVLNPCGTHIPMQAKHPYPKNKGDSFYLKRMNIQQCGACSLPSPPHLGLCLERSLQPPLLQALLKTKAASAYHTGSWITCLPHLFPFQQKSKRLPQARTSLFLSFQADQGCVGVQFSRWGFLY